MITCGDGNVCDMCGQRLSLDEEHSSSKVERVIFLDCLIINLH
jgi:hypothetical protein